MTINATNHLNFRGDARAALEFYQSVFGGDVVIITYEDAHNVQDPSEANQVMWGQVAVPDAVEPRRERVFRLNPRRLGQGNCRALGEAIR